MTTGRRPAGAPAGWQERQPAGAPDAADEGVRGAGPTDEVDNAPTDAENESAEAVEGDLAALLDDIKRERDEYLELAQRAKADFENYRKRAAQQASDAERRAKVSLASSILPAIDNLERALEAAEERDAPGRQAEEAARIDSLTDGVRLVLGDLTGALNRAGVESFDPNGERFDPTSSEALSTQPGNAAESGTVLQTLTRGYRLGDHVIRPARVVVAE